MTLEGEVRVEEGSFSSAPALEIDVVEGFKLALQTSNSTGEKLLVSLSPKLSGD
jgi:hypothetical protein